MIAAGEDLTAQDGFVGTALHWAALKDNADAASVLIEAGIEVNLPTLGTQETPLHIGSSLDHIDVVKLPIEAGADLEARNIGGTTPLMQAAGGNAADAIELLVAEGADIDAKSPSGRTALTTAVRRRGADAVRKLIELGADVNGAPETEPVFSFTPLANAIYLGRDEIADILRAAGASE